ncbi:MAG: UAA transporter [Piccolia ochrophora]|nr:MAG: UAA transporter [Piccolia ochrophora]
MDLANAPVPYFYRNTERTRGSPLHDPSNTPVDPFAFNRSGQLIDLPVTPESSTTSEGPRKSLDRASSSSSSKDATVDDSTGSGTKQSILDAIAKGRLSRASSIFVRYFISYLALSIMLLYSNKWALQKLPYPCLLTALQTSCTWMGCKIALPHHNLRWRSLPHYMRRYLVAYSALYTINIALSNASLQHVTIAFHQVVRATTPFFVALVYKCVYGEAQGGRLWLSLLTVVAGVCLATLGDYGSTTWGFVMTLIGAIAAASKTISTNRLQRAEFAMLQPLLLFVSPLASLQSLITATLNGEVLDFYRRGLPLLMTTNGTFGILLANLALAFGLSIVSFEANKRLGALSMTVAGNMKQVFTIVGSICFSDVQVGVVHIGGIIITFIGGWWYARIKIDEHAAKIEAPLLPRHSQD